VNSAWYLMLAAIDAESGSKVSKEAANTV